MKTQLRLGDHEILQGQNVIELWYDGKFIGEVTGADGPGVRITSKRLLCAVEASVGSLQVTEIRIES